MLSDEEVEKLGVTCAGTDRSAYYATLKTIPGFGITSRKTSSSDFNLKVFEVDMTWSAW